MTSLSDPVSSSTKKSSDFSNDNTSTTAEEDDMSGVFESGCEFVPPPLMEFLKEARCTLQSTQASIRQQLKASTSRATTESSYGDSNENQVPVMVEDDSDKRLKREILGKYQGEVMGDSLSYGSTTESSLAVPRMIAVDVGCTNEDEPLGEDVEKKDTLDEQTIRAQRAMELNEEIIKRCEERQAGLHSKAEERIAEDVSNEEQDKEDATEERPNPSTESSAFPEIPSGEALAAALEAVRDKVAESIMQKSTPENIDKEGSAIDAKTTPDAQAQQAAHKGSTKSFKSYSFPFVEAARVKASKMVPTFCVSPSVSSTTEKAQTAVTRKSKLARRLVRVEQARTRFRKRQKQAMKALKKSLKDRPPTEGDEYSPDRSSRLPSPKREPSQQALLTPMNDSQTAEWIDKDPDITMLEMDNEHPMKVSKGLKTVDEAPEDEVTLASDSTENNQKSQASKREELPKPVRVIDHLRESLTKAREEAAALTSSKLVPKEASKSATTPKPPTYSHYENSKYWNVANSSRHPSEGREMFKVHSRNQMRPNRLSRKFRLISKRESKVERVPLMQLESF